MDISKKIADKISALIASECMDEGAASALMQWLDELDVSVCISRYEEDGRTRSDDYTVQAYLMNDGGPLDEISIRVTLSSIVDEEIDTHTGVNGLDLDAAPALLRLAADMEAQAAKIRAAVSEAV